MVQEFHVLRCFSCRTFQVQQVKKSKKWSCRLCGEKQSLMKEYGRGTGADCRRHVQKLNSLRGELLEVENERAWTQWEKEEECEVEVGPADEQKIHAATCRNAKHSRRSLQRQGQVVSRWSKYVDQKENGPGRDDEQREEESVYTDKQQYLQRNNVRKRKKSCSSWAACRSFTVGGDEDTGTARWGATGLPSRPPWHDATFKSSPQVQRSSTGFPCSSTSQRTDAVCGSPAASLGSKHISVYNGICSRTTGANKQSSAELSTKPEPSVPLSSVFAPSFSHQHPSDYKLEAKDSKWARFLPSVCIEDKDEGDGDERAQCANIDHPSLAQSPVMPLAKAPLKNTSCMSSGEPEGALLDKGFGIRKVTVFKKLSHCMNGNVCKQPKSPTITSRPVGSQEPVCVQPLPIKRSWPAISFSTLFQTDEDFDDAY